MEALNANILVIEYDGHSKNDKSLSDILST